MTLEKEIENILVFKTNINTEQDYLNIKSLLDSHIEIREWSIDREDVDRVLRINSGTGIVVKIVELITNAGFFCEELTN